MKLLKCLLLCLFVFLGKFDQVLLKSGNGTNIEISSNCLNYFFDKYGNGHFMNLSDFKKLLGDSHILHDLTKADSEKEHNHDHDHDHDHHFAEEHNHHHNDVNEGINYVEVIKRLNLSNTNVLHKEDLLSLPSEMIVELDAKFCNSSLDKKKLAQSSKHFWHSIANMPKERWIYSIVSVILISLVGFISVYLVSLLNQKFPLFGRHLTPFLVALAVGTLSGDALIHLIPHAFIENHHHKRSQSHTHSDNHSHGDHYKGALKGLAALVGLYLFFLGEKLMQIRRSMKEKSHKKELLKRAENSFLSNNIITLNEFTEHDCVEKEKVGHRPSLIIHGNKELKYISEYLANEESDDPSLKENDSYNKILNDNSHTHSHSHMIKKRAKMHHHSHHKQEIEDVKSNAWMAVMGDGLHNFTDGLAIGAAFASDLTTGITTAIAVFCHELPHEIGNFAVLRKAGMKIKRALLFNIVSSVLCLCGVLLGLIIGRLEIFNGWMLLFVSGTFLYISLVDMIPELAEEEDNFKSFIIQSIGIFLGAGIMLIIALFEDKIANALI